jgi:predicted DNA-binding protein
MKDRKRHRTFGEVPIALRLPLLLELRIRAASQQTGESMSALIRRAIESAFEGSVDERPSDSSQ